MTEDELKAIDQRLAAMSERVDAVIERESRKATVLIPDDGKVGGSRRLHPMPILDFKPRARPVPAIASNSQQLHRGNYQPSPELDTEQYNDGSIEQIFAEFERQFDEMAQAHRWRA